MTGKAGSLIREAALPYFFYERVGEAQVQTGVSLDEELEAYGVALLTQLVGDTSVAGRTSEPLAMQYLAAVHQGRAAFRAVGDRALAIYGILPQSMRRKPVGLHYVRSLGESAYAQVSQGEVALAVFDKLARRFDEVAQIIGVAAAQEIARDDSRALMELFERWTAHQDPADAQRLRKLGVKIDGNDEGKIH